MSLSTEAVISLVTLITTAPPALLVLWAYFRRQRLAVDTRESATFTSPFPLLW
jgi:hypothetical protein